MHHGVTRNARIINQNVNLSKFCFSYRNSGIDCFGVAGVTTNRQDAQILARGLRRPLV